jgi:small-conductance mechanosensitive channel
MPLIERARFDSNRRHLVRAVVYHGTWAIGLLAALSTLGLNSASMAATIGISGIVLGFGFKDILSHLFAGFMLLLGSQFHVGDQIVVKEFEGTVERIELRALYLRTYDNRLVIIPNGDVFTSAVISNTDCAFRRREFIIRVSYQDNLELALAIALAAVTDIEGVAEEPAPDILVDELSATTINLKVRFYTHSQRADYLRVGSQCMAKVKEVFQANNRWMPTDTQTVSIEKIAMSPVATAGPSAFQ